MIHPQSFRVQKNDSPLLALHNRYRGRQLCAVGEPLHPVGLLARREGLGLGNVDGMHAAVDDHMKCQREAASVVNQEYPAVVPLVRYEYQKFMCSDWEAGDRAASIGLCANQDLMARHVSFCQESEKGGILGPD